jgi:2-methylcitrate dehydratase PrpD
VGAFGSAAAAARLSGLDETGIAAAQGIVGSLAAGSLQFLDTGAWTKRMHPGWAASTALTSTRFAAAGWEAPPDVYEGRFGLYASHVPEGHKIDPEAAARGLGEEWELLRVAIKPFPACHFTHAFADATIALPGDPSQRITHAASLSRGVGRHGGREGRQHTAARERTSGADHDSTVTGLRSGEGLKTPRTMRAGTR